MNLIGLIFLIIIIIIILYLLYQYWSITPPYPHLKIDLSDLKPQPTIVLPTQIKKMSVDGKDGKVEFIESNNLNTVCQIMLQATHYGTLLDNHLQNKIGGIVWMDGNGAPETLCTFNYSKYDSRHKILFNPLYQRCHWAWPTNTSAYRTLFTDFPKPTRQCSLVDFSDDFLQFNIWLQDDYLDLSKLFGFTKFFTTNRIVQFPSIAKESLGNGFEIIRKCIWFNTIEFGSYTARQIMKNDGTRVEPAFTECETYLKEKNITLQLYFK
jgi:hypothetical protein